MSDSAPASPLPVSAVAPTPDPAPLPDTLPADDTPLAEPAAAAEPAVEPAATFEGRGFDLRLAPPTEPADQPREPAAAIVARLVENSQRCRERIESLHRKLGGNA
ncbi:MAG TPA: hypothetical protein PLU79_09320 [Burkholderiaceae bacterium]|nr:hypothetical protein [Burkholderiaceae bacterium]